MYLLQQSIFILRNKIRPKITGGIRKIFYKFCGMQIGNGTYLPATHISWPHQVKIGDCCSLEGGIHFKFEGIWGIGPSIIIGDSVFIGMACEFNISMRIEIGNNTLIASGCKFIDHDHGIAAAQLVKLQQSTKKGITIGNDVWLGCNVIVLKGITIGDGAIVGAGSVVTKSILSNEIWAGIPARKLGERKKV